MTMRFAGAALAAVMACAGMGASAERAEAFALFDAVVTSSNDSGGFLAPDSFKIGQKVVIEVQDTNQNGDYPFNYFVYQTTVINIYYSISQANDYFDYGFRFENGLAYGAGFYGANISYNAQNGFQITRSEGNSNLDVTSQSVIFPSNGTMLDYPIAVAGSYAINFGYSGMFDGEEQGGYYSAAFSLFDFRSSGALSPIPLPSSLHLLGASLLVMGIAGGMVRHIASSKA